ncbi:MAG TPA: ABC transporter permease [Chloroflexota bacterium]|jgi:NitT/TauT family transport system permease protein
MAATSANEIVVREAPRTRRAAPIGRRGLLRLLIAVALVGGWEAGVHLGWIDPFFFSSPSAIAATLGKQVQSGAIYKHLSATLQEALWGLVLGALGGAALAWLATRSQVISDLLDPLLLLLNSVPRIVLAPIFVMWLGIGMNSKIAVAFFLVFVVVFFAVAAGIREVDRTLVERIVVLGGSPRDLLLEVYLPSVLSWVFSSLRVAVGFAFTGAIVGEFVGASSGLGYLMNFAQGSQNASLMMVTVVVIMAVIAVLFAILERVERRLMAWK